MFIGRRGRKGGSQQGDDNKEDIVLNTYFTRESEDAGQSNQGTAEQRMQRALAQRRAGIGAHRLNAEQQREQKKTSISELKSSNLRYKIMERHSEKKRRRRGRGPLVDYGSDDSDDEDDDDEEEEEEEKGNAEAGRKEDGGEGNETTEGGTDVVDYGDDLDDLTQEAETSKTAAAAGDDDDDGGMSAMSKSSRFSINRKGRNRQRISEIRRMIGVERRKVTPASNPATITSTAAGNGDTSIKRNKKKRRKRSRGKTNE